MKTWTSFVLEGSRIIKEIKPNHVVYYHYDNEGMLSGFNYNGDEYFYIRSLTGNIEKVIDSNGNIIVEYGYDAWGSVLSITGDAEIKDINNFLYKGYYYDFETSLYYCNSRYYDPAIARWISADDVAYLDPESINGLNLFAYCGNNPVMRIDPDGNKWWHWAIAATGVLLLGIAVICTAGLAGAVPAVVLAANGVASAGVWTTIAAFAFVGAATAFAEAAITAGGNAIISMSKGESVKSAWNDMMDAGEQALENTAYATIFGGIAGYATWI